MSISTISASWAPWAPILSSDHIVEKFDNTTTTATIENIFIILGAVLISTLLTFLFYWAYRTNKKLFISLLSGFLFLYSLMNIIGTVIIRSSINNTYFKVYLGAGVIVASLSIILIIMFSAMASKEMRSGFSSNQDNINIS